MANLKPFILNALPASLTASAIYFVKHPLDAKLMQVHVASSDGLTSRCVYTTSPMDSFHPPLYDATSYTYSGGNLSSKAFYLDSLEIATISFIYTAGNLTEKRLYIDSTFVSKVSYTYASGNLETSLYSTVL